MLRETLTVKSALENTQELITVTILSTILKKQKKEIKLTDRKF